jgi:hypothetical protein
MKRIFVVPKNDAEAVRIIEILQEKNEKLLITSQSWGASWEGLEEEIKKELHEYDKKYQLSIDSKIAIYGVELKGNNEYNAIDIDHHCYDNEDRSNKKSSLEQVAEIINYQLSNYDKMISANDTGYIPAMQNLDIDIAAEERESLIIKVRALDRKCQGITEEQEEQAIESIENNLEKIDETIIVKSPHSKCACYTDRLFGKYKRLLVISEDGESNFYGDKYTIEELFNKFEGWKGGNIEGNNGYWGGYGDQNEIEKIVREGEAN